MVKRYARTRRCANKWPSIRCTAPAYTKVFTRYAPLAKLRNSSNPVTPSSAGLPQLLRNTDGSAITSAQKWRQRVQEIGPALISLVYGALPPKPRRTRAKLLHRI